MIKPFTKIVDYTAEELDEAISIAADHCTAHQMNFYDILRGVDAYFEKRHRKINPAATRISSWQGDHSTGEWKTHGTTAKQELRRQSSGQRHSGAPSTGSHGGAVQQGPDPAEADPGDTPSLGSGSPRRKAKSAGHEDEERGPSSPNPAVPNGRRSAGQRRPGPERAS